MGPRFFSPAARTSVDLFFFYNGKRQRQRPSRAPDPCSQVEGAIPRGPGGEGVKLKSNEELRTCLVHSTNGSWTNASSTVINDSELVRKICRLISAALRNTPKRDLISYRPVVHYLPLPSPLGVRMAYRSKPRPGYFGLTLYSRDAHGIYHVVG